MLIEQSKLHQLLAKPNQTQSDMQQIVLALRNGCYDIPDASFQYSYKLLKKNPNSQQSTSKKYKEYILVDELIHSGLQLNVPSSTIKSYLKWFINKMGEVPYLKRLGSFINYVLSPQVDESHFDLLLRQNGTDLDTLKRKITSSKRNKNIDQYAKRINQYLVLNPNDQQAWVQLGQLYIERGQFFRAIFCFEQLQILVPNNDHYVTRLAELYYTQGGKDNIETAIKYFSFVVAKNPKSYRALWGLNSALNTPNLPNEKEYTQLKKKTQECLLKFYGDNGLNIQTALKHGKNIGKGNKANKGNKDGQNQSQMKQ